MSHDQRRDSELPPAKSAVQTSANDVMSRDSVDHFDPTVSGSLPLNYSSEFWAPDFRTSAWKAGALDRQDVLSKRLHPTLVHALVAAAKLEGDFGVTVLPERERDAPEVMTYRELYEDARSIANGLRELGTGRGDRILIVLPTCMDFLAVFFACQMVGAIPVPAYPPSGFRIETGLKRLAHIAQHSGSRLCVTWGTVGPLISEIAHTAKSLERVVNVQDLRGGRLPAWAQPVAEWLGLTPIARIKPSGRLGMAGGLFGTSNVPVRFAAHVARRVDRTKAWRLVVGHCDAADDGAAVLAALRDRITVREGWLVETGSAIGAHAGPGALVVSLQPAD